MDAQYGPPGDVAMRGSESKAPRLEEALTEEVTPEDGQYEGFLFLIYFSLCGSYNVLAHVTDFCKNLSCGIIWVFFLY